MRTAKIGPDLRLTPIQIPVGPWVIGTEIKFTGTAFCSCLLLSCSMEHKKKPVAKKQTNKMQRIQQ